MGRAQVSSFALIKKLLAEEEKLKRPIGYDLSGAETRGDI